MSGCVACGRSLTSVAARCPHCGAAVPDARAVVVAGSDLDLTTLGPSSPPESAPGGLSPGDTIAGRYRIVSLLGRGGMGEVYRADDLTLGQPVALKFLPVAFDKDPGRLQRFRQEVRLARQVSHPNVCRVYDIGETGGRHFISMEYIDGEDLASLLRRIGRLPVDKAVEIARQMCAGLHAAHERGVLHRDLKPANVMLDGGGKVRIADFGLAEVEAPDQGRAFAGTPAYMAPELLDGQPATVQSDLFALGLVIQEVLTGKRLFDAPTIDGLRQQHRYSSAAGLTSSIADVDPAIDRIVERCLDRNPSSRPASALAVSAALPGGDPLAAALAAGETPSPELVAASGERGSLHPMIALGCVVATVLLVAAVIALSSKTMLYRMISSPASPDVLEARAREILTRFGYAEPPADSSWLIAARTDYLSHIARFDQSDLRWSRLETTPAVFFGYRQSPEELVPMLPAGRVHGNDPPVDVPGMATVWVNLQGRLLNLSALPPQYVDAASSPESEPADVDWQALFDEAGLDMAAFTEVEPKWVPPMAYDRRRAWEGVYPSTPPFRAHIEAASFMGRPVRFTVRGPWDVPERAVPPSGSERAANLAMLAIVLVVWLAALLLARRNARTRRGDPQGAMRLAVFVLSLEMLAWAMDAHHLASESEVLMFILALGWCGVRAFFVWCLYLALEPFARRRWPRVLVGWTRALSGRWRDPLVGRDLLVGVSAGALGALVLTSQALAPFWLGGPPPEPEFHASKEIGIAISHIPQGIIAALFTLFSLLFLRLLLRRDRLAMVAFILISTLVWAPLTGHTAPAQLVLEFVASVLAVLVLVRFGLLALSVLLVVRQLLMLVPMTFDPTVWYAPTSATFIVLIAGLMLWGFHTSRAGQPLLGRLLEE